MQAQTNPTVKDDQAKNVIVKKKESSPSETHNRKEDAIEQNITARTQPFRVKTRNDTLFYDNSINDEVLDL